MTTEKAESKLYESLPQPNEDKPITVDTFSPWVIQIARIKYFNGVKNSPEIMAVYSHLLGWKKTTGEIRPSQQYIADCCCMGLSTVQKKVKVLVKMGWITATPACKPGSKEISHTDYTVKDPEEILAELNAGLSQQGDAVVTIAKNQKVKTGESGKDEQKQQDDEQPVTTTSAAAAGVGKSVPPMGVPVDADLSGGDDAVNGGNAIQFPTVKSPDQPQMVDIDTLNNWVEGYDDEGFMAYGATWGIEKPGAITDLIKSHIRIIQSDGYKGSRSAANDTSSGPDAYYKQKQARRATEAKQATNTPQQQEDEQLEFNDDEPF
ncbi:MULTISPECIES: hypothetical protein [Enterobacteriaceae]|uniref:hypothetical protein n=1 Tax=Enterobacteriaceae TaxID=543 RepID=UPI0022655B8E|nr:hypothetical protein [Enterobacter pseudoroggenkampii]MCX8289070.1 hypothetical protein [Enterobacter pseudoroggenkampii]HBW1968998.1 hypothetical protein [Klebsiella quasipneumoniae subsp. similipneumoniae]HCM7454539.1 hypothetical protein [Klebsiella quasipneumoniae]